MSTHNETSLSTGEVLVPYNKSELLHNGSYHYKFSNDDEDYEYAIWKTLAIYVYSSLIILSIILLTSRSVYFFKVAMNASKSLHSKMFSALLITPMKFFDTNPSGRILNRFSRDMGIIDEILPRMVLEAIQVS